MTAETNVPRFEGYGVPKPNELTRREILKRELAHWATQLEIARNHVNRINRSLDEGGEDSDE